jgi:hypothetical protein
MTARPFTRTMLGPVVAAALVAACSSPTGGVDKSTAFVVQGNDSGSQIDGTVLLAADSTAWLSGGPTSAVADAEVGIFVRRDTTIQTDTSGVSYQSYVWHHVSSVTADGQGHFVVNGLAPDWYRLIVTPQPAAGGLLELYVPDGSGSSGLTVRLVVFEH